MARSSITVLATVLGLSTSLWLLSLLACVNDPAADGDGDADVDADADADGDADGDADADLPSCPAGEPHLVIGLRRLDYQLGSRLLRRDQNLQPCRGLRLAPEVGEVYVVGGTSSGADLVGSRTGHVLLIEGDATVWPIQHELSQPAASVFTIQFQGREVVAVLWFDSAGNNADKLTLHDMETGDGLEEYGVSIMVSHAAPPLDGSADHLTGLVEWDGAEQYSVIPDGISLGSTDAFQVPGPVSVGDYNWLDVTGDRAAVAVDEGVLYWSRGESAAFLGPMACRWPAFEGGQLPDGDEQYIAAAVDITSADHYFAAARGRLEGSDDNDSWLFRLSYRGECEILATGGAAMQVSAVAWSGL